MTDTQRHRPGDRGSPEGKARASILTGKETASTVSPEGREAPGEGNLTLDEWVQRESWTKLHNAVRGLLAKNNLCGVDWHDQEDLAGQGLFRLQRKYAEETRPPAVWLAMYMRTVHNLAIDFLRRRKRRRKGRENTESIAAFTEVDPAERATPYMDRQEMIDEFHALKQQGCRITDQDIEILVAYYWDKSTLEDIKRARGCKSATTIHRRLDAARSNLRGFLGAE
jgi:DNA-directed RNA polymerase specialized sigma24 family protein